MLRIFFLTFLLVIVSCGKSSPKKSVQKTRITEEEIQFVMSHQSITCGAIDGNRCPEGIVRILVLNKEDADESRVCSGFMVSATRMITNNHCIANQRECDSTHLAIYDGRVKRARCSKFIDTLDDNLPASNPRKKLDVTVVEIDSFYSGDVFSPAKNELENGEMTRAWVVDHSGLNNRLGANLLEARITEFRCVHDADAGFRSLFFNRCPLIGGNSGSPMLNRNGEVVGVIWGASEIEYNADISQLGFRRMLRDAFALVTDVKFFEHYFQ